MWVHEIFGKPHRRKFTGGVPTINLRVDYLRPAVGSVLTGTARVRRAGRTVAFVDVDVYDEQRALVAVGRSTYSGQRG